MPVLETLIIVECSALKVFPKSYFNLKTLQIIKIYGCSSLIMEDLRELRESNKMIEVKTMSIEDTRDSRNRYSQLMTEMKSWLYGEFWSNNDVFNFLRSLYTLLYMVTSRKGSPLTLTNIDQSILKIHNSHKKNIYSSIMYIYLLCGFECRCRKI